MSGPSISATSVGTTATLPPETDLAARGLYDVFIDSRIFASNATSPALTTGFGSHGQRMDRADWVVGTALYTPATDYPPFEEVSPGTKVQFHYCPHGNPVSASYFRRQAQVKVIDTLPFVQPGESYLPSSPASGSSGPSTPTSEKNFPRRFRPPCRIIAWWEDELGLWFITEAAEVDVGPFLDVWQQTIGSGWPMQKSLGPDGKPIPVDWAEACNLLAQSAQCLRALHERRLSLNFCHPSVFWFANNQVIVDQLWHSTALPGLSLPEILPPALATSPLFTRDPLQHTATTLSEQFIVSHLRYMAPEVAMTKRVEGSNDIYGWGVFAYELITGKTIDGSVGPDISSVDILTDIHKHVTDLAEPPLDFLKDVHKRTKGAIDLPPRHLSDIVMLALAKDPEDRYHNSDSLIYDLRKLSQILRTNGDLAKFTVGEVDRISRFHLPAKVIDRKTHLGVLDSAFESVARGTATSRAVSIWGNTGTGKTRLVEQWSQELESQQQGTSCLIGWSQPMEQKPLISFNQVFQFLLDRVLTDPREDSKEWMAKIKLALGSQWVFFVSMLPPETRRLIWEDQAPPPPSLEWSKFLIAFRGWSRRLLQVFATKTRPLVLLIDDIQWLSDEEVEIWRDLMDGSQPLNHVLLVTMTRTGSTHPSTQTALSASALSLHVGPFGEEAVREYIDICLNHRVASSGEAFSSFLYGETGGSPLFLATLMTTLYKEGVVAFDYDSLQWRFDLSALQIYLSDASFDSYLEGVMRRSSPDIQRLFMLLSHLPSAGIGIPLLAETLRKSIADVEIMIQQAASTNALVVKNNTVRFSHDKQRTAAQRLIPTDQEGIIHGQAYHILTHKAVRGRYVNDAVERAMAARRLGRQVASDADLVSLILEATHRAITASNLLAAHHFVHFAQQIIMSSGGVLAWIKDHRRMTFDFVNCSAELANIFHEHDSAFTMLEQVKPICKTPTEKITVSTLLVRQLVTSMKYTEAVEEMLACLDEFSYGLENPRNIALWEPKTVEEIDEFERQLFGQPTAPVKADERRDEALIMDLISYAGPTIYITQPQQRFYIFRIGLSIARLLGSMQESTAYLLAVHSMTINNPPVQNALLRLAKRCTATRPGTFLSSAALVAIAGQAHFFTNLEGVTEEMDRSFEASISLADFEIGSYTVALDMAARLFSKVPVAWDICARRYDMIKAYATTSHHVLFNMTLQYAENLARPLGEEPWILIGQFFGLNDYEATQSFHMHRGVYDCLTLRLKLLFDAPIDELQRSLESGLDTVCYTEGLVYGIEMHWLLAVAAVRCQADPEIVAEHREQLSKFASYSADTRYRLLFVEAIQSLYEDPFDSLAAVEELAAEFDSEEQYLLSGLLNYIVADVLIERTGSLKLATGFVRSAFAGYRMSGAAGACEVLRQRYPMLCPTTTVTSRGPTEFFMPDHIPVARRPSMSTLSITNETMTTSSQAPHGGGDAISSSQDTQTLSERDQLDTLALMRSSLALAQEKDSLVLLCTLLKILCQFMRCDYAAIGLTDEGDRSVLRLKAAGPFQRILPYNLDVAEASAQSICPTSIMLHVSRTGTPITQPAKAHRLRNDPFFDDRQPRMLMCLPIVNQGVQSGVILLMSMSNAATALQSESAREVISTLATFAYIIHMHHVFTSRLKTEVTMRTRELTAALQAKTLFLSQCSHELRSPLAAIMGLAAVLENSAGLSPVQREHLGTILTSGNDLLALISNILDHSKLESNSVLLEHIPFSVRDVVESALDTVAPVAQSKNVELTVLSIFRNDPPGLLGDPFRVKQVVFNLLSNAVKFTPPGERGKRTARVTVERMWEDLGNGQIKIILAVEDSGVGIPASKLNKLFKSFSQVDESITRSYGGSGLGLVISRDLASLLGGDCTVESEFGKGSMFTFSFVGTRDPNWKPTPIRRFAQPKRLFLLCSRDMVWGRLLEEDTKEFNCIPTRFVDEAKLALDPGRANGLNSGLEYAFCLIDAPAVDLDTLTRMRELQPRAKFLFVTRITEIAAEMDRLHLTRESILARPLKFKSVHDAIIPTDSPKGGAAPAPKAKRPINKQLGKEKPLVVLVVDDAPVNIQVCKRILELYGYKDVDSATDGLQATEMAEKRRYDLILLDLQMPVLDGFGALERIKASPLAGEPCCVSLSANVDKATRTRCSEAGFFAVLDKPVDIPRLGEILATVYKHRKGLSGEEDGEETSATPAAPATQPSASPEPASSPSVSPASSMSTSSVSPLASTSLSVSPTASSSPSASPTASTAPSISSKAPINNRIVPKKAANNIKIPVLEAAETPKPPKPTNTTTEQPNGTS